MSPQRARLLALALVLSAASPLLAAEGRIPIFVSPTVINAPGKYFVSRNLTAAGGGPMIDVQSDNVDIDLNGFTLDHAGFGGPCVNSAGFNRISVRNGKLIGGGDTISFTSVNQAVVEDVKVFNSLGVAIRLDTSTEFAVRRNQVFTAITDGILVSNPGGLVTGTIEENHIQGALTGVHVQWGAAVAILHNRILSTTGGPGAIALENSAGCLVSENTMDDAGANGIYLFNTRKSKLYDNVVSFPKQNGIYLNAGSFGNLILNNVVGAAILNGLLIEGNQNLVERNTLTNNSGFGLRFALGSIGNTFGRNEARNNAAVGVPACVPGGPALFPPNSCNEGVGVGQNQNSTFGDNLIPGPPIF